MPMQCLNDFQSGASIDILAQRSIFTGSEVGLKIRGCGRKSFSDGSRKFYRAHRSLSKSAQPQTLSPKPLPCNSYHGRSGACIAIERTQRFKKFNWHCTRRWRKIAYGTAAPAETEYHENCRQAEANPKQG